LLKYKKYPKAKIFSTIRPKRIDIYIKEIARHYVDQEWIHSYKYPQIKMKMSKDENYKCYSIQKCKEYDILNANKLARGFEYFEMTDYQMNPSGTHLLFGVDFIGNRCFHLFIKGLYSNEIKELRIKKHAVVDTKEIFNNDSTVTDNFTWLTDETIAYIAMDQYYNQKGAYVYNIFNHRIYSFAKIPHGYFAELNTTTDNRYVVFNICDYNSDEIYIMDNDDRLKLGKPIFKRQFSVTYPMIDHADEWIIHEQNKGIDRLKRTLDFKKYRVDYINEKTNEQIIKAQFVDDTYIFTLCHLKGIKLYTLKCGKLSLIKNEEVGYIHFDISSMDHFHYRTSFYLTPTPTPKYYERKVYIKDLCFTVLSKNKPTLSKCILVGYGSYNTIDVPVYSPHYVALILGGWTIVIAHLRGGGEYGYKGYNDGRLIHKKNTFLDFIKIADYLVEHKYTTYKRLAIWGRSAGGLLITNVINMRPDICQLAILGVPFVMPIETMADYKNPLGLESRSEFSYKYANEIDPISNINLSHDYPNIFIYSNYYDTLVPYKEPLKYYNAMKEADVFKEKDIHIYIDNKYGHTQGTSKKSKLHIYSIIMEQLDTYIKE
jgi:protease II